jgi:hypothetical protein
MFLKVCENNDLGVEGESGREEKLTGADTDGTGYLLTEDVRPYLFIQKGEE